MLSGHSSSSSFISQAGVGACGRVPGWLVSHFLSFVSQARCRPHFLSPTSFHLSPRLGASGPVPGWLVSHFLAFVSHFLLFVSHFFSFAGLVLVVGFPAGLSPSSLPVSALFRRPRSISIHLQGLSLLVSALVRWPCSVTGGVRPFPLAM